MNRVLARLAATLLAAPLAFAAAAPAQAYDVTVPGCYGVGVAVCDLTVSVTSPTGVETYETQVPVCAGTCQYVPVTLARPASTGDPLRVCVSWYDLSGTGTSICTDSLPDPAILYAVRWTVADVLDGVADGMCSTTVACSYILRQAIRDVADIVRP